MADSAPPGVRVRLLEAMHLLHFSLIHGRRIDHLAEAFSGIIPVGTRTVLDVGSGDGLLASEVVRRRPELEFRGVDVLARKEAFIPVELFNGHRLPFDANSFDAVIFSDVLHHSTNQVELLTDAGRVASASVVIKDHINERRIDEWRLRVMDYVGNRHNGVSLPYDYWSRSEWERAFRQADLRIEDFHSSVRVYPNPLNVVIGGPLHCLMLLTPA
ncbi:MAG: class I SAM-dependent methyltransferase [Actinobacteria bacterium]|nr:class I SAM-dependent methyltransferase [Actinomycetota bacterium]